MTEHVPLQAEGLTFHYANQRGVQGIDLQLQRGEILGLLGLNGAGKSTTLRLLAGVLRATAGWVRIAGQSLRPGAAAGRRQLGFLPENVPLYPELSVDEQLRFSARLYGLSARQARGAAAQARQRCGLDAVSRRRVAALSQGMRRRLGIAQAMVHRPAVLLFDEPTVALDPVQIVQMRELIRELSHDSAVILSSHVLGEVEALCSRVAVLHEGRLVHEQTLPGTSPSAQLTIGLARDPGIGALRSAAHSASVSALGGGRYRIEGVALQDLAPRLAQHAVEQNWGLLELTPHTETLERKFIALTQETAVVSP